MNRWITRFVLLGGLACAVAGPGPNMTSEERDRAKVMLRDVESDIKKNYYDPNYHGLDLTARFKEAEQKINAATSFNMALADVAAAMDALNDSHTFLIPPPRPYRLYNGWVMGMIGDKCYILGVKPGSDAAAKGLKPGDEILSVDGYAPTRAILWKLDYLFRVLKPQPGLRLVVRSPNGAERTLDAMAREKQLKMAVMDMNDIWDLIREGENAEWELLQRTYEFGDDVMIWKMPMFDLSPSEVDKLTGRARHFKTLILDLRGNPGGYVEVLKRVVSDTFDHNVNLFDTVSRKGRKTNEAKSAGGSAFTGKLIVLVDSRSASSAEIYARVVQLEKRGTVVGDHSEGAVMEAFHYPHQVGNSLSGIVLYSDSVTIADAVMGDGKSLEKVGVTPDVVVLPTGADLAAERDPALAAAAALAGLNLSPQQAGKFFPIEWPKE